MTFSDKIKVFVQSAVTWAAVVSVALTAILTEVQAAEWFPEAAAGEILKWGAIALGVIGAAVRVIKQVTPVPVDGMQVVVDDGTTVDVNRGWE